MKHPDVVFKQNYPVFSSEKRIYGTDSKLNHRLKSPIVYNALFEDVKVQWFPTRSPKLPFAIVQWLLVTV